MTENLNFHLNFILFFTSLVVITTIATAAFGSEYLSIDCRRDRALHLREILWDALYSVFTDHILLLVEQRQQRNPCDSKTMLDFSSRTKSMSLQTKPPWNTSTYNYGELVGVRPFAAAVGRELENPSRIFLKRNKQTKMEENVLPGQQGPEGPTAPRKGK